MNRTIVRYGLQAVVIGVAGAVMASSASAQRYAGAGGLGAALGGMLGVGLPAPGESAGSGSSGGNDVGRPLKTVVARLNAGEMTSIPASAQLQVAAVLDASAPSNLASLVSALVSGGVSRAAANGLATGLTMLGTSKGSYRTLVDATKAYNEAVNSLAVGAPAPPVLLAVRAALSPLLEPATK